MSADDPSRDPTPRGSSGRLTVCLVTVAVLVAVDLWSKTRVFEWLESIRVQLAAEGSSHPHFHGEPRIQLVGDWFAFMLNENNGAAFGQLQNIPYVLVGGRVAAALLLVWLILRAPAGGRLFLVSLVLILSGALGNLYDNLLRPPDGDRPFGPVRDFIDVFFPFWNWHFPTFNFADSCISVGAVVLLLSGFGARAEEAEPGPAEEPAT